MFIQNLFYRYLGTQHEIWTETRIRKSWSSNKDSLVCRPSVAEVSSRWKTSGRINGMIKILFISVMPLRLKQSHALVQLLWGASLSVNALLFTRMSKFIPQSAINFYFFENKSWREVHRHLTPSNKKQDIIAWQYSCKHVTQTGHEGIANEPEIAHKVTNGSGNKWH